MQNAANFCLKPQDDAPPLDGPPFESAAFDLVGTRLCRSVLQRRHGAPFTIKAVPCDMASFSGNDDLIGALSNDLLWQHANEQN